MDKSFGTALRGIIVLAVATFLTAQVAVCQSWYNSSWPYRAPITIDNSLASALTGYQVQVTLGASGPWSRSSNDGSDLVFTTSDGITQIPYWIEEWTYGVSALIWVKVPALPASGSTTIYMYYGAEVVQSEESVATSPAGPFTKDSRNPGVINGTGAPAADADLLPENIVYDPVSQHYWMVLSDQTTASRVALIYSDDPTNPDAWYWSGYVIANGIAPHLIENNGTWYIFYGDRSVAAPYPISVATSSSVGGPYTKIAEVLQPGDLDSWEDARVDEPFVFQRSDGTWVLMYMGDAGGNVEQVGYATANAIAGPYTKYAGNPCIPFGPTGSYDNGTVADPWVYEFGGVYYIGYTVSPTTSSPWQTALAATTDWTTFTKYGLILESGTEFNSFRGAVTRIGDEYVFSYSGGPSSGEYRMCIATQPVYQTFNTSAAGSDGEATFDFFDGFNGSSLDTDNKWDFHTGNLSQTAVGGGLLTMSVTRTGATGVFVRIDAESSFGIGYVGETRGQHPDQGTENLIAEAGFATGWTDYLRIVDDFPSVTNWERQTARTGGSDATRTSMGVTADAGWHIFRVYRESNTLARFQIDNQAIEPDNTNIPTINLPPFLMSYSNVASTTNTFIVDWTRVRKWAGAEMTASVGDSQFNGSQWTGSVDTDWDNEANWIGGIPGAGTNVLITDTINQPLIDLNAYCDSIIINPGATIDISGDNTLTVYGNWTNYADGLTITSGTVVFGGTTQAIKGDFQTGFNNLTISGISETTLVIMLTVTSTLDVAAGTTLKISGANTLPSASVYVISPGSTIEFAGSVQTVADVPYGNLRLSGSGTKTFADALEIDGNLTITGPAVAFLPGVTVSEAASLVLGGSAVSAGEYGSTSSTAAIQNDTYFAGTGTLNVTGGLSAGSWLGLADSDWNNTANWAGNAVPGASTDVIIESFAVSKPVISDMTTLAECNNMTIGSGASLTIDAGQRLTINGTLTNNGSIMIESSWVNSNGSLIVMGAPSGTGTVSYRRFLREGDDTGDKHLLSSPVVGQDITVFIAAYDVKIDSVRTWNELGGVWTEVEADEFISAKGYNIYQADDSDGEFTFMGSVINSASITATSPFEEPFSLRGTDPYGNADPSTINWTDGREYISGTWTNWGGGGWNLLGNPFTSAMNADLFITDNTLDFDPYYQALYVYDGKNGYYRYVASVVPGYDQQGQEGFIQGGSFGSQVQAGQGFMVMANNNGVEFNFNSSMQVHNTVLPLLKSAATEDPWPGMKLKVKWGEKENMTTIVFDGDMNVGLDPGYDVGQLSTGPEVEVYTALVGRDKGVNLTRQALPVAGADTLAIPLGIDCYAGAEVTFSAITVPLGDKRFWLEDRTTGVFTDLTTKSYTVTIPENTYGTGRFYILASANTPTGINRPEAEETGVRIWIAMDKIIIKGDVSNRAVCEIYDLQGNRILENRLADSELNTVDIPTDLHGVLFVRVIDGMKVFTRKVAVL